MDTTQKRAGSGGPGRGQGAKAADGVTNVARYNVTLDAVSESVARQIGGGDRSLGIRRALGKAHAEWVREKSGESLADSRPNISHQQVMLDAQALIDSHRTGD